MRQDDLNVNREIRRVLVRHWIDLGRLSVRTISGNTYIHGSLIRIEGFKDDLTTPIVNAIFNEMKRIRNLSHMRIELDNWANNAGSWIPQDKKTESHKASRSKPQASTYNIDKELKKNQREEGNGSRET
ncbi:hypothetical protein ACFLS1_12660 [Verrucomicrobiota bacterium]